MRKTIRLLFLLLLMLFANVPVVAQTTYSMIQTNPANLPESSTVNMSGRITLSRHTLWVRGARRERWGDRRGTSPSGPWR